MRYFHSRKIGWLFFLGSIAITRWVIAAPASVQNTREQGGKTLDTLPASPGAALYVIGPDAGEKMGERPIQVVFFRFHEDIQGPITISVFDPDSGGKYDVSRGERATRTFFGVYGGAGAYTDKDARFVFPDSRQKGKLLVSKTFTTEYDGQWFTFGPLKVSDGERVGRFYYFKLMVLAQNGASENRFRVAVSPERGGEAFCFNASMVIPAGNSKGVDVYVEIPGTAEKIIGISYGVGPKNGKTYLKTPRRSLRLSQPSSREWTRYDIDLLPAERGRRLLFHVTSETKEDLRCIVAFTDSAGSPLHLFGKQEGLPAAGGDKVRAVQAAGAGARGSAGRKQVRQDEKAVAATLARREPTLPAKTRAGTSRRPVPEPARPKVKGEPWQVFVFDASKTRDPDNDPLSFEWDFGDGSPKEHKVKVVHVYKRPGRYRVTLTVDDGAGSPNSVGRVSQDVVVNAPPVVVVDVPDVVAVGEEVVFDGTKSHDTRGDVLSFNWDFGDGVKAEGPRVKHAYSKGGIYKVVLVVRDDKGTRFSTARAERKVRANAAPDADAGDDIVIATKDPKERFEVVLDGSGSSDPDGDTLSYSWRFNDGVELKGARARRTFQAGGRYEATLTVSDNSGASNESAIDTIKIVLNHAPLPLFRVKPAVALGEDVAFDATGSSDPDGDKLTYLWDFGDGKGARSAVARHSYRKPGVYTVKLSVDDGQGTEVSVQSMEQKIEVRGVPLVARIRPVKPGLVNQWFQFDAEVEGAVPDATLSYCWDFGDGRASTGRKAYHAFRKGGAYKVKLLVRESGSPAREASAEALVRVNTPPVPVLKILGQVCCTGKPIRFDASESHDADKDKLKYQWDFGDGTTSNAVSPAHAYQEGGIYRVMLTVDDGSGLPGSSASTSTVVKINRAPVPVISIAGYPGQ